MPVKSSVIAKIGYDNGVLFVKFVENGWYKYRVSKQLFDKFLSAPSKGTFLNQEIKRVDSGTKCSSLELEKVR